MNCYYNDGGHTHHLHYTSVAPQRYTQWASLIADLNAHCRWRHNWKSAQVVNSYLVCDPTIQQPGFDLPQQQWSLLNRFRMEQGHCGACRRKWRLTDTDLCPCGETQTMSNTAVPAEGNGDLQTLILCPCGETHSMSHIVKSCSLTKLNGGLARLHSADENAVSWLTNYGK